MAVPLNSSERHGVDGGRGDARRRWRVCSVAARERARGGEELGERVRGLGGRVAVSVALEGPRGREAGREEATASLALSPRTCLSSWQEEEDHTAPGGLGLFCQVKPR